jgi:probable selenium-dependent hydroxylase accessory protein YqeC
MWYSPRIDPFELLSGKKYVSFVGAGGKTSFAEYLANEAIRRGMRAAVTTTTNVFAVEPFQTIGQARRKKRPLAPFMRFGKTVESGGPDSKAKLTGLNEDEILELGESYDIVLIEADGAKRLPLKYPAAHEPVIPACAGLVVVVAGLDALGRPVREAVFRWELFQKASGIRPEDVVDISVLLRLFEADGLMKDVDRRKACLFLNKLDAVSGGKATMDVAQSVVEKADVLRAVIGTVRHGAFYDLHHV